jgi:ribonuclease HI
VGLDYVTAEDMAELLDNHGQHLSNEDVDELAKELIQQEEKEKEKDEEPHLKCM